MVEKTMKARLGDFVHHVNGLIAQGVDPLELRDIMKNLDESWVAHYKDCANEYNYDCAIEISERLKSGGSKGKQSDAFEDQFKKFDGVPT